MANWDNQQTRLEQEKQSATFDEGVLAGDAFVGYPLPECANKAVKMLTPYERGFLLGWWLKQWLKG